jgi:phage replication initiation protein
MENSPVPPTSNRGVQNTSLCPLTALVDWVSVTFPLVGGYNGKIEDLGRFSAEKVVSYLGLKMSDFKQMETGINGYKKQLKRGHISVLYDGNGVDMGVHLIMSGQGCREFESEYLEGWRHFFSKVFWEKAHFTRLDIAVDDFQGYVKIDQIVWRLDHGLSCSRFKDYRYMKKGKIADGTNLGMTIYYGSPQSDIQIRIYDKLKERVAAGKEIAPDVHHWVRTEIQLSDKRADMAASQIVYEGAVGNTNMGVVAAGILKNYVGFYEKKTSDKNKSRWPKWKRWEKFLGEVSKLKLTLIAPDKTMGTRHAWIDGQTAKTLGMLFLAYDSDLEWLIDILNRGMELLGEKEFNEVDAYKRNKLLLDKYLLEMRSDKLEQGSFDSFNNYLAYYSQLQTRIREIEKKEAALEGDSKDD